MKVWASHLPRLCAAAFSKVGLATVTKVNGEGEYNLRRQDPTPAGCSHGATHLEAQMCSRRVALAKSLLVSGHLGPHTSGVPVTGLQ